MGLGSGPPSSFIFTLSLFSLGSTLSAGSAWLILPFFHSMIPCGIPVDADNIIPTSASSIGMETPPTLQAVPDLADRELSENAILGGPLVALKKKSGQGGRMAGS